MKISKLFHWLYFIVMMLPILSIPIFAIYSHRHTIDSYSVQVEETKVVDFNQEISFRDRSWSYNGIDFVSNGNYLNLHGTSVEGGNFNYIQTNYDIPLVQGHTYAFYGWSGSLNTYAVALYNGVYAFNGFSSTNFVSDYTGNFNFMFVVRASDYAFDNVTFYFNLHDLTKMFGSGNEPNFEEFRNFYANDYYEYTLSHKELLKTGNYITYDNTDIGSQFTYSSYNVVDKYFNYDNVFNFGQLYDWLNMTFFNGGASLGFFIFWHLLIYWLLTSLIWLIFDVLLYVPNLVHRWLDKASLS